MDDLELPQTYKRNPAESPIKEWRLKYQTGIITINDLIQFVTTESKKYYTCYYETDRDPHRPSLMCLYKDKEAKEGVVDVILEFIMGDNPEHKLEQLKKEGNTAAVCGRVFKAGEPTYSCRECGMDPTCVLCVNCFKKSAHRYHKYKMSTSCGGGCCDCGDEEAWKKDHYCEEHLQGKQNQQNSSIITKAVKERCDLTFRAILTFCMNFLQIESNASLQCLDTDGSDETGEDNNCFCTILYNDESHTFDQVITTLEKIVKCRRKDANDIVSSIDREGRAVVKCDTFSNCKQLKDSIEKQHTTTNANPVLQRQNQSLRVSVLSIRAVACQQLAIQLLNWLQDFLVRHCSFREIFAKLVLEKEKYSVKCILENDVKLWKTARTCFHRLLISGMLMEYSNKMQLAKEFAKQYSTIMQEFIRDDHDHSFSIVSLSVQLFTVPSISHYLIAQEGIFYKLLHIFYHESVESLVKNKTLHFTKTLQNLASFKRSAYILYDLRYLLSFKPDTWTDLLREGFLDGCKALLRLLNVMQGMEAIKRQVGQHMDYEPEWESAFNLHVKLAVNISLALTWSITDEHVLRKFYVMVMRAMVNSDFIVKDCLREERHYAGHTTECVIYDVSAQPVSIHLPLSRLFAALYLQLGEYGLDYHSAIVTMPKRSPEELMEPVLCAQVMIAQVNASMWRRNGYSLLHQLFFYRNVRFRQEMLDRDICVMQIAASLIEANEFMIHVLNKFGLLEWASPGYEETNVYKTATEEDFTRFCTLVDELLELLIAIIGERHMPGISNYTEDDRTKKEIIQLLCIKNYSHSELHRALPETNNETVLEDLIDTVAVFKKPARSDAKGVYELREEHYDEYNMYFYHYTKEEKSKSEETIRKRRQKLGELVCCPPPKLPKLSKNFLPLVDLLQCDAMMQFMDVIISRGLNGSTKAFSDNHLQKVLHLIGYGLQEQQSGNYPSLEFYERALALRFPQKLEELASSSHVAAQRDFILWVVKKFKELKPVKETAQESDPTRRGRPSNSESMQSEDIEPSNDVLEREKKERARLAAESRARIMAQIQSAQKNFIRNNADLLAGVNSGSGGAKATASMDWQDDQSDDEKEGAVAYKTTACLGFDRRIQQQDEYHYKCILCFEECAVGQTLVYSAFIQRSKVSPPENDDLFSLYTSSCGHVMHASCWQEYYNNEETKEQRRPRVRPLYPPGQNAEFLCPYCRCLSNTVLPLVSPLSKYSPPNVIHTGEDVFPFDQFVEVLRSFNKQLEPLRGREAINRHFTWDYILAQSNLVVNVKKFEKIAQPINRVKLTDTWIRYMEHYIKAMRHFAPTEFESNEHEGFMWMLHTCTFTIQSVEMYLRVTAKPLKDEMNIRHQSCMSGLIRACSLYGAHLPLMEAKHIMEPVKRLLDTVFNQAGQSVLEWNCFKMMTSMIFLVPSLLFATDNFKTIVCSGSMMDFYTLELFFLANMVKAIVLYNGRQAEAEVADESMDIEDDEELMQEVRGMSEEVQATVLNFYYKYNVEYRRGHQMKRGGDPLGLDEDLSLSGSSEKEGEDGAELPPSPPPIDFSTPKNRQTNLLIIARLFEHIKMEMRDFLRCSCLFYHFVTDVEFPDEFAYSGSDTYENMVKYLGLSPRLDVYFDNKGSFMTMMDIFASHPDIVNYAWKPRDDFRMVPCTRPVPRLTQLPEDYSDLINSVSDFICVNNDREEMKTPTLCLVCGTVICAQSYCCQLELDGQGQVGACTYHNHHCGADIGMFLRIRDCQVVLLGRSKGVLIQAPYLDEYGETDQGLKRGNPLRLCPERYKKLHLLWLGHAIHDEISRLNDGMSSAILQWHHM